MTQPTPYARQYSFSSFQAQNPTGPLPAQKLDLELNSVKITLDQVLTNLALLQRDDGKLANGSVGTTQLDAVIISLGFSRPTTWAVATQYAVNSAVFQNNALYICLVAHTSAVFATDLALAKWVLAVDFNSIITPVQGYSTSAQTYAASAQASSISASASFTTFDKRWLGPKTVDPIIDNQAAPLAAGAGYFNTATSLFRIYNGTAWFTVAGAGIGYLVNSNNLSDVLSAATTRANINAASLGANTYTGDQTVTGNINATGVIQGAAPTGSILEYYGTAAPTGYLFANGAAVSRTAYAALFAVIGVAGGPGDGSTTFNLPDKRGAIAVGADNMGGAAANKVQVSTTITTVIGSASATVSSSVGLCAGMKVVAAGVLAGTTISTIAGTAVTLSANATASAPVSGRFSIFTDAQVVGSVGGETVHQLTVAELASHTHIASNTVGFTTNSGGTVLLAQNGSAGANNTSATGNDMAHNNVQPSIICNFIIKT